MVKFPSLLSSDSPSPPSSPPSSSSSPPSPPSPLPVSVGPGRRRYLFSPSPSPSPPFTPSSRASSPEAPVLLLRWAPPYTDPPARPSSFSLDKSYWEGTPTPRDWPSLADCIRTLLLRCCCFCCPSLFLEEVDGWNPYSAVELNSRVMLGYVPLQKRGWDD